MSSTLATALDELRRNARFGAHITAWRVLAAQAPRYAPAPAALDAHIGGQLAAQGLVGLYAHQACAIDAALGRSDVAVVTGAASGKSLCYNAPVAQALLTDPSATALHLFPTKALAQDQLAAWQRFSAGLLPESLAATYDGDTPASARPRVRATVRLLITNPDMLHVGILPQHTKWRAFLQGLRYVVLDEMHIYRGLFGSHLANVLRRLLRLCAWYGSHPTFICCSATIANPGELAQQLLGRKVAIIDEDGAPRGEKHFLFYNPPLLDATAHVRQELEIESAAIADHFLAHGLSTLVFARGRQTMELLLTTLRAALEQRGANPRCVRGYRGGYLARERRAIEKGLRSGSTIGVVATNALELGVDIGELSVAVLSGYPGTIASTWQQAGRAGRRREVSAAVLVGGPEALDQYLLAHPDYFFGQTPEQALLAADNPYVLRSHLGCAAFELPLAADEALASAPQHAALLAEMSTDAGPLRYSHGRWYWMSSRQPAHEVSLRTATAEQFAIVTSGGETIGLVDSPSAPFLVHPGAIYVHEGQSYLVEELDSARRIARVRRETLDYFTVVSRSTKVDVQRVAQEATPGPAQGEVCVTTQATGYDQVSWTTRERLASLPLDLPEQQLMTTAYWFSLDALTVEAMRDAGDWTIAPIVSYGPNWDEQRRRARERDRYRCRNCGRPESPGREHDVHHRRPFRQFDYRPQQNEHYRRANVLSNLITLCPDCHRRAETTESAQGTLDGLAHLMHALAPLHIMAAVHDLGVAAELDFRLNRAPTVVLYDAVPGGAGFSQALYAQHRTLLRECRMWVEQCPCEEGCPACIGAPWRPKTGAKARVQRLLRRVTWDSSE